MSEWDVFVFVKRLSSGLVWRASVRVVRTAVEAEQSSLWDRDSSWANKPEVMLHKLYRINVLVQLKFTLPCFYLISFFGWTFWLFFFYPSTLSKPKTSQVCICLSAQCGVAIHPPLHNLNCTSELCYENGFVCACACVREGHLSGGLPVQLGNKPTLLKSSGRERCVGGVGGELSLSHYEWPTGTLYVT